MRHPALADDFKFYIARRKILDTYIKANQDLHKKLLALLENVNKLVQEHNVGLSLRDEIIQEIDRSETSIEVSINEKRYFDERISTLLSA